MKIFRKKRLCVLYRKFVRSFEKKPNLSNIQKQSISIAKRALYNKRADLLIAPLSDFKYIRYDDIFIKLENQMITIINGKYLYQISIPSKYSDELSKKFNNKVELVRSDWENTIREKTEKSLSSISYDMDNYINII